MKIELTDREIDKLKEILLERYHGSTRLLEIGIIKTILQKIGSEPEDWMPTL